MQDDHASITALGVAYLRAAHQLIDIRPCILEDPIAVPLLGAAANGHILGNQDRYQAQGARALRAHVVLRSRFAEERLAAAVERGIRRYILVGAGFDTFAWRQPSWARQLQIIEVDHPGTQRRKQAMVAEAGLTTPDNVQFAGIDFEIESLAQGLARLGIGNETPTFFSWLGVTMYLSTAAIEASLACMTAFPAGSETVLSFKRPGTPGRLARMVAQAGEPFVSCFTPAQMRACLLGAGFRDICFLTPALAGCYFPAGENALSCPQWVSIVAAIV